MPSLLPVLQKTWQYNVNQFLYAARGTDLNAQQLLWTIKQSFITPAQNPWTVVGSSNGVTAGLDGVDRWTDSTKLLWAGDAAARSWIVLRQEGLGGAAQLLFDCTTIATGTAAGIRCMFSPTLGFTGGTVSARPTAVDEQGIMSGGTATGGILPNNGNNMKVHYMQSSDGQCTRLFITAGRNILIFALFDVLENVSVPWNAPIVYCFLPVHISLTYLIDVNAPQFNLRMNGTAARGVGSVEAATQIYPNYFTLQNEVSQRWHMWPMGLAQNNVAGLRGRYARFADLWAGPWYDNVTFSSKRVGDMYPADGSNQFAQMGPLLVPWGGNPSPMSGKL